MNLEAIPSQAVYLAKKGRLTQSLGRPLASSSVAPVITALQKDKTTKPQRVQRVQTEQRRHLELPMLPNASRNHRYLATRVLAGTGNQTAYARSVLLEHSVTMQETVECVLQAPSKTKTVDPTALQTVLRTHRVSFCRVA